MPDLSAAWGTGNASGSTGYTVSAAGAAVLGPAATDAANKLYATATPQEATPAVNALFGAQLQGSELTTAANATAAQDLAQGQAEGVTAQGDQLEANSYLKAGGVADKNARLERASAGIQSYQEDIAAERALGGQEADIAGAGFGSGGSGFYLARAGIQQASLAKALINVQGSITAGGFEQQSLAAQAEAAAASGAADRANILGNAATDAAGTAVSTANQTASDLNTNALNSALALAGLSTSATAATTGSVDSFGNPATAGLIGRTGVGMDPTAFVTSGGAPQTPSPFGTPGGTQGAAGGTPIANVRVIGG
jgi:hypothetical protein